MKKIITLISLGFLIASCGKDKTTEVEATKTIATGAYFLESETKDTATAYTVKTEGNEITFVKIHYPDKHNTASGFYSYSKGTYSMNGDIASITYTEEMCDVVGKEDLKIRSLDDAITIEKDGYTLRFAKDTSYSPKYASENFTVMQKDINCQY